MNRLSALVVLVVMVALIVAGCPNGNYPSSSGFEVSSNTEPLQAEAAPVVQRWQAPPDLAKYILSMRTEAINDPVPEIRQLFQKMEQLEEARMLSVEYAVDLGDHFVAASCLGIGGHANTIEIWISTAKAKSLAETLSPDDFRDEMLVIVGHQVLHVLNTPYQRGDVWKFDYQQIVDNEAKVADLTVTQLIRPLVKAGRYVRPFDVKMDKAFRSCGSQQCPQWRDWIEEKYCPLEGW